jgi:cytochrome c553
MKKIAIAAGALLATTSIYAIAQEAPAPSREGGYGLGREALARGNRGMGHRHSSRRSGPARGGRRCLDGRGAFVTHCSACHGDFGEAVGRWPVLAGGSAR